MTCSTCSIGHPVDRLALLLPQAFVPSAHHVVGSCTCSCWAELSPTHACAHGAHVCAGSLRPNWLLSDWCLPSWRLSPFGASAICDWITSVRRIVRRMVQQKRWRRTDAGAKTSLRRARRQAAGLQLSPPPRIPSPLTPRSFAVLAPTGHKKTRQAQQSARERSKARVNDRRAERCAAKLCCLLQTCAPCAPGHRVSRR